MSTIIHYPFPARPVPRRPRRPSLKQTDGALHWGAKLARLRVEHPEAAALRELMIDDTLTGREIKVE